MRRARQAAATTPTGIIRKLDQNKQLISPLLALPRELRDQICSYVVGGDYLHVTDGGTKVRLCRQPRRFHLRLGSIKSSPILQAFRRDLASHDDCYIDREDQPVASGISWPLLLVCRQLYNEASPLVFSANVFVFRRYYMVERFILMHSEEQRLAMRDVILEKLFDVDRVSFRLTPNLARITIFALLHNRGEYCPSHSHVQTFELLSEQLSRLTRVSVCLEYSGISYATGWGFRKAEGNIEGFLMGNASLSQVTIRLLE
ncbi:hypothetical protein Q7P37_009739 [Cladosporium fusiforme]